MFQRRIAMAVGGLLLACGPASKSKVNVEPMTHAEAQKDFDQMLAAVEEFYGPYEYKEQRFGYNIKDMAAGYRAKITETKSDAEVYGIYSQFLAQLQDGHVGIRFYNYNHDISSYVVDMFVVPVLDKDGKYKTYVGKFGDAFKGAGIDLWDELVSVDGKPTMDYLPIIRKYQTVGYEGTDRHFIYRVLNRPAFMTELAPKQNRVSLIFKKADGAVRSVDAVWEVKHDAEVNFVNDKYAGQWIWTGLDEFNKAAENTLNDMRAVKPFFINDMLKNKFDLQTVTPNSDMLQKYGFAAGAKVPDIYAAVYTFKGKRVLLVRNRIYSHDPATEGFSNEDYMNYYRALLDQWESVVDVLVVDQTHNGGGSYCEAFFSLFVNEEKNGFVQKCNADRRWIRTFFDWANTGGFIDVDEELRKSYLENAAQVEAAIDRGDSLTGPLPIINYARTRPDQKYTWQKPFLVLVDELAGSCADAYPALIKYNNVAKLFGHRTMGLGGNVEQVAQLNISGANMRLTRGLFTVNDPQGLYPAERYVENNGVEVDYKHDLMIDDVRAGFVNYFTQVSETALLQLATPEGK